MKQIEQGYSLLELLIAISLALFLSAGMISIFMHSRNTYQLTQSLNKVQTNARIAFNSLNRDIRMAGLIGCVRLIDFLPLHSDLTLDNSLVVWHKGHTTAKLALPNLRRVQAESDIILIQLLNPNTIPIKFAKGHNISLLKRAVFRPNDVLLISDCQHAEVFQWDQINLMYSYKIDSEIGFLDRIIYYIGDTGRRNEIGQAIYALYRRNLNKSIHKPTELVEGIEKMSIRLGIKNGANRILNYVNADQVKQWSDARSVEISLLLNEGKYFRRIWKHIIALRERAYG